MKTNSVDPKEVAYYEKLAETWWDRDGILWPLHRLNELRTRYLCNQICAHFGRDPDRDTPLSGLWILDIGCGGGLLCESLAKLGANMHGIDVTEKNILIAQRHSEGNALPIRYEHMTAETLAESGKQYDVVLNMEVVEHVSDLPLFMEACCSMVASKGLMFISTINRNFKSWLFAIVGAEYLLRWLPKGTHQWKRFVKPNELEKLLARHEMEVSSKAGVRVNPLTRRFSLCDNLSVNYMVVARPGLPAGDLD